VLGGESYRVKVWRTFRPRPESQCELRGREGIPHSEPKGNPSPGNKGEVQGAELEREALKKGEEGG
jgi:hypothetical protein